MAVIQMTTVLASVANLIADYNIGAPLVQRINESRNSPLISSNASQALARGVPYFQNFTKLFLFVSSGPSNVTIRTLDGNSFTLSALATNTSLILDVQFSMVTWTGTATAVGFYTE